MLLLFMCNNMFFVFSSIIVFFNKASFLTNITHQHECYIVN